MLRSSTRRDGTRTRLRWRCRRSRRDYPGRFAIMGAHDIIFSSNVRMAAPGHQERFPPPSLRDLCVQRGDLRRNARQRARHAVSGHPPLRLRVRLRPQRIGRSLEKMLRLMVECDPRMFVLFRKRRCSAAQSSQRNPADPRAVHDANSANTPTGRYATPEEVANAVMYLCPDLASDITGTHLVIDGGRSGSGGAPSGTRR
jgi:hypothetical protein